MAKRTKRREWLDKKITEYTAERVSVLEELTRDAVAIEELEVVEAKEKLVEASIETLTAELLAATGDDAKEAMAKLEKAKERLEELREQLRSVYYDR